MTAFTRETIVDAFREVGEILFQRKTIGDVTVFGGSAMLLQFDVSFVTEDIDAVIGEGHGQVMRAVQEVGRRRGWTSTWLNEGVSVYLSPDARAQLTPFGSFPDDERVGLRVYVAAPDYLLALKLRALRVGSRDVEDVVTLARHLKLSTAEQLVEAVVRNFPNEPLDGRRRLMLPDILERLR